MSWSNLSLLPYDFEIYSKTIDRYGKKKIPKGMTIQDWGITYDDLEPYYDRFKKQQDYPVNQILSGKSDPMRNIRLHH